VLEPLAYARVVQRIGNEENVIDVDLEDVIPRHVQMTVSVSASTTDGQPLPESELRRVLEACAMMESLDTARSKLTRFVGRRMGLVAPNLSEVCGAEVAAKLVGAAGGLARLSEIPACNIQVLGQRKRINAGLSSRSAGANQGFVHGCPLVANVPPDYRRKAAKLVANKVALLGRYDAFGSSDTRSGEQGRIMKAQMEKTIEKWMELPTAAIVKPLVAPDGVTKKRRGGKRWRKMKERIATTEMMKQANRMQFGTAEEEFIDGDEMYGLGMLGKDGHGKLKIMQAASKLSKKEKALAKGALTGSGSRGGAAGGLLSGTQSSLAFSAVQGIELENPNKEEEEKSNVGGTRTSGTESYFSELSGFKTFRKIG
jgi:U4/U6 small nuclear ribonucleoprotein PRP31